MDFDHYRVRPKQKIDLKNWEPLGLVWDVERAGTWARQVGSSPRLLAFMPSAEAQRAHLWRCPLWQSSQACRYS